MSWLYRQLFKCCRALQMLEANIYSYNPMNTRPNLYIYRLRRNIYVNLLIFSFCSAFPSRFGFSNLFCFFFFTFFPRFLASVCNIFISVPLSNSFRYGTAFNHHNTTSALSALPPFIWILHAHHLNVHSMTFRSRKSYKNRFSLYLLYGLVLRC